MLSIPNYVINRGRPPESWYAGMEVFPQHFIRGILSFPAKVLFSLGFRKAQKTAILFLNVKKNRIVFFNLTIRSEIDRMEDGLFGL